MTEDVIHPRGGRLTVARSRGMVSGVLLVLLGLWGALIPFVGPYFHFAFHPDTTWHWTAARGWYEVLPGSVSVLGGLLLIVSANRLLTSLGAWLAAAAGGWFVVAPTLAPVLTLGSIHAPVSPGVVKSTLESLTLFSGLGAMIVLVAAVAVGRLSVRSVRDINAANATTNPVEPAEASPVEPEPVAHQEPPQLVYGEPQDGAVATTEHPDGAYAPGGATPVTDEPPPGQAQGGPAYPPAEPAPPVQQAVERPPGYGQRVPTYYHGGPAPRPEAADDES